MAAAAFIGLAGVASAADLPSRRSPAPFVAVPIFTWEGVYVGVNAGYGISNNASATSCAAGGVAGGPGCTIVPNVRTDGDGFVGGGQIGHNWQFGDIVAGIEADIQYADVGGRGTVASPFAVVGAGPTAAGGNFSARQSLDYIGTLRGRIGYVFGDRLMVFASGGLAYGQVSVRESLFFPATLNFAATSRSTDVGYAAGAGVEYAFTNNLTGKIEGLYYDLGRRTVTGTTVAGFTRTTRFDTEGGILRAGINYKFNLF